MVRCSTPSQRSIEFRQASPSRNYDVIYGWTALMALLTHAASAKVDGTLSYELPTSAVSVEMFCAWIRQIETQLEWSGISEWVAWRDDHLNAKPTPEMKTALLELLRSGSKGLYGIASTMNVNYSRVKIMVDDMIQEGSIVQTASNSLRYRLANAAVTDYDTELARLEEAAVLRHVMAGVVNPAQELSTTAAPC